MQPAVQSVPLLHYRYTFDAASNILGIEDLRPPSAVPSDDPRRDSRTFGYDGLYRLASAEFMSGRIEYRYDRLGNMLAKTSNITHAELGRSITALGQMSYGGAAGRTGRSQRAAGDPPGPHALTSVENGSRSYAYDENGNMTALDGRALEWDFKDRLIAAEGAGMRAEYVYDYTDRRVTKHVTPKPVNQQDPALPASTTLYVGRHFEVRANGEAVKYVFNGEKRIVNEAHIEPKWGALWGPTGPCLPYVPFVRPK